MVKRQAENPLEEVANQASPVPKKVRIDDGTEPQKLRDGLNPPIQDVSLDGHKPEAGKRSSYESSTTTNREGKERTRAISVSVPSDEDEVEQTAYSTTMRQTAPLEGYTDLYLDTINRSVLDFDFEKLCSVTLSNINVYACLVCGKYYQGRGPKSHAYFHALDTGHHVYINMQSKRVYVLPEGYEVKSRSLEDIKFVVDPRLSREEVSKLDKEAKEAFDLGGKKYRPGTLRNFLMVLKFNLLPRLCWFE